MGLYVTIEGPEYVGKTTIINILKEKLDNDKFIFTKEPDSELLNGVFKIKEYWKNDNLIVDNDADALLFATQRSLHITNVVLPTLKENKNIISDRGLDASLVYQSNDWNKKDNEFVPTPFDIDRLHKQFCKNIYPDITFIILEDPRICYDRHISKIRNEDETTKFDESGFEIYKMMHEGYKKLPHQFRFRNYVIINIHGRTPEAIADVCIDYMKHLIKI